jgi:hypothetical protein
MESGNARSQLLEIHKSTLNLNISSEHASGRSEFRGETHNFVNTKDKQE